MFRTVNLGSLENVLQRNLRTERARECIFRAFGGTNFENVPYWRHSGVFVDSMYVPVYPKKTLDMPLRCPHFTVYSVRRGVPSFLRGQM